MWFSLCSESSMLLVCVVLLLIRLVSLFWGIRVCFVWWYRCIMVVIWLVFFGRIRKFLVRFCGW